MEKEREKLWWRARLPTRHVHSLSHGASEGPERRRGKGRILLFWGVGARSPWGTADNVSKTLTEWRRGMGSGRSEGRSSDGGRKRRKKKNRHRGARSRKRKMCPKICKSESGQLRVGHPRGENYRPLSPPFSSCPEIAGFEIWSGFEK